MKVKNLMAIVALAAVSGSVQGANPVSVQPLGGDNTLVRVEADSRYLLLPVEDNGPESRITVLADGDQAKTVTVRLAKNRTDYYVPFDLTPYKGKNVEFLVKTFDGELPDGTAAGYSCWSDFKAGDTFDATNREAYRPAYHHTPEWGWMNDPNGMFYKDGVWHLYYQWNPYGSKWQNMTWGHSTSRDLVNWEHHPAAIEPGGLGSVFSGSCAVDPNDPDKVWAMYTAAGDRQMQSMAWSDDNGETFTQYPGNPVIALDTEARDPNMFWDAANNRWVLVLAHPLDHEMLFFTSPDMKEWTLMSSFGKVAAQGGVWECPDFFQLTAPDGTRKWVLLCNLNPGGPFGGSATQYFVGDFDGKTFTADTDASGEIPTKWLDFGKDHYATVSWSDAPDGRRTVIGWMSNWQYAADVPTEQYRSANTLPREMELFRAADGQYYVASAPSPELDALRDRLVTKASFVAKSTPRAFSIPELCEISLDINASRPMTLTLSNAKGEKTVMTYNPADHTMAFDRTQSGLTDFSRDFPAVTVSPTFERNGKVSLRIFVDRSSIELFGNRGRFVQTNLVFPTQPYSTLTVTAPSGKAKVSDLRIYSLSTK